MNKTETVDALMESAIFSFSKDGYEGASLRDIARHANVPLSTIHFYFGSKSELFSAVARQAWAEIDRERSWYLEKAIAENGGPSPRLPALMHSLAFPVVLRALSNCERDIGQIFILRSHISHLRAGNADQMLEVADRSMTRWIDAMMLCCPSLGRQDIIWAFSFAVGAIYSWQMIDHRYDKMLGPETRRAPEDVTDDIVAFCCNGIQAIVDRRAAAAVPTPIIA